MIGEDDLDGAVIEQFCMTLAGDFVHFVESGPCEEDRRGAVAEVERRLHRAEGDFATVASADGDRRGAAEVEIGAIPKIGLDDAPTADQLAVPRHAHAGTATSFGSRTRL